jgi:hypothetical protein
MTSVPLTAACPASDKERSVSMAQAQLPDVGAKMMGASRALPRLTLSVTDPS